MNSALTALSTDFDNRDEHSKTGFIVPWSHSQLTATKSDFLVCFVDIDMKRQEQNKIKICKLLFFTSSENYCSKETKAEFIA